MTVTKEGLVDEIQSFVRFTQKYMNEWHEFCDKERDGKQSIENLLMLVKSLTGKEYVWAYGEPPWRFLVSSQLLSKMTQNLTELAMTLKEIKEWEKHEA